MKRKQNPQLTYKARKNANLHIDTKNRIIQIKDSEKDLVNNVYVKRLVKENGFQVEFVTEYTIDRRVYISGPIAHYDIEERKSAFKKIEDKLRHSGYHPVNPFNNGIPDDADPKVHLRKDAQMLLECEAIYFMDGWTQSRGCLW